MKKLFLSILFIFLNYSFDATAQAWKSECIGYYQLQLPDNLEVALYPAGLIINPRKDPAWRKNDPADRYLFPKISFGEDVYQDNNDRTQAQFSNFYYNDYEINISSESESIDFLKYEEDFKARTDVHIQDYWNRRDYRLSINLSILPKELVEQSLKYHIDNYTDAFSASDFGGYSLFINKNKRLYIFNKSDEAPSQDEQLKKSKPEVLSLLNRFRPRKLYEVPTEQGFCLPYGFIAGDSGHEKRNMGVTYRLKDHPDVSIFFQDLGPNPGPGEQRPYERRPDEKMSAKDYVTYFWNRRYGHSFREIKLYGKGFSSPKIDHRDGAAAFAKFTRRSKEVDFGYMAYVKGNAENTEPGLLFYVIRDSRQAKDQLPMDKDELEKIAEHIVSSIKRR